MYIQLTTRCNMRCAHCCYDCTSKGEDMSFSTFQRAVTQSSQYESWLTLGGGEPTLCRDFPEMMEWLEDWVLTNTEFRRGDSGVFMVTNGTRYRNTMRAVRLMEKVEDLGMEDAFWVVLSSGDGYHDDMRINRRVLTYFLDRKSYSRHSRYPKEAIRAVQRVINAGRAYHPSKPRECACETVTVKPSGDVRVCGCPQSPSLGSIWGDSAISEYFENGGTEMCYKEREEADVA